MRTLIVKAFSSVLLRFALVGGMATLLDFAVYMMLSSAISVTFSKLISMCTSCVFSFLVNRRWTFEDRRNVTIFQITRYATVQIVNVGANVGINALTYLFTRSRIVSFFVATAVAMTVNFLLQKLIVFPKNANMPRN